MSIPFSLSREDGCRKPNDVADVGLDVRGFRRSYCGGTYKGLTGKLDYIKGMGFDVVSL